MYDVVVIMNFYPFSISFVIHVRFSLANIGGWEENIILYSCWRRANKRTYVCCAMHSKILMVCYDTVHFCTFFFLVLIIQRHTSFYMKDIPFSFHRLYIIQINITKICWSKKAHFFLKMKHRNRRIFFIFRQFYSKMFRSKIWIAIKMNKNTCLLR